MKEQAIDNKELILALEELEKEKGIKKEYLLESIETALVTAYKRNFDSLENVKIEMDKKTGATHVYALKDVMEKNHMSKSRLCRITGLRFETIQGYYLGTISRIDLYVLSLLCKNLNCKIEDLIEYKDN